MAADSPDAAASVAAGSDSAITTTVSSTARVATWRNTIPATTATSADVAAIRVGPCDPIPTAPTISRPQALDKPKAASCPIGLMIGVRLAAGGDRAPHASIGPGCDP